MIKVIGTGSQGNCYLIQANENEKLLVECGLPFKKILEGLDFNLKGVFSCLITHEHKDHCKASKDLLEKGISIYTNKETAINLGIISHYRCYTTQNETFKIGGFTITSFESNHTNNDNTKCPSQCFIIHHKDIGKILFVTDTYYLKYKFKDIDYMLVEANYTEDILDTLEEHRARIIKSHMSLETLKKSLITWDLTKTKKIVLIHLSSSNADPDRFRNEVQELTGIDTIVAKAGLIID